jgi:diguanylate cyclase (GGDEF)-like protein
MICLLSPSGATGKRWLTSDIVIDIENPSFQPSTASLLLLSIHHRDALAAKLATTGWGVTAARRVDGIENRFVASNALFAIVDLRGAKEDGLLAMSRLVDPIATNGAAMLAIIDRSDEAVIDRAVSAGATHLLMAPFSDAEFFASLRLAHHYVQQTAGNWTEQKQISRKANTTDVRDLLTGLQNARAARKWVAKRLMSPADQKLNTFICLVSVSRLDMINSAFGVDTGDSVLRALAQRIGPLVTELGSETLVARIAGTEFAVCVAGDVSVQRMTMLAESIAETIERPFSASGDIVRLGCRIGIVQREPVDQDPAQLLRRASAALAEAKALDSGRIKLITGNSAMVSDRSPTLHADLRSALMNGEIDILFQPQVSVTERNIVGVEALARWHHPVHGLLGAATLFSVAHQSDYEIELSEHVQKRAAESAATWPDALSNLRLSINVTAADVARPSFVDNFLAMIDATGFPRKRLTVEITETGLMEDLAAASAILASLRASGCRVAIDDFGTGYSSLAYLKSLPLDYLKIDKGLSEDIAGSTRDSIVVRGVIDMARSLGLAVIAEGVETEEQLTLLAREGCNYYQGFLCAEPLDVAALTDLVLAY